MGYWRRNLSPRRRSRSKCQATFSASVCEWRSSRTRWVLIRTVEVTPHPPRRCGAPSPLGEGSVVEYLPADSGIGADADARFVVCARRVPICRGGLAKREALAFLHSTRSIPAPPTDFSYLSSFTLHTSARPSSFRIHSSFFPAILNPLSFADRPDQSGRHPPAPWPFGVRIRRLKFSFCEGGKVSVDFLVLLQVLDRHFRGTESFSLVARKLAI